MMEALFSQDQVYQLRERIATKEAASKARAEGRVEGKEEGIEIGEKKGEVKTFWKLVCRKLLSKARAAKELGISVAQFDELCKGYAFA